MARNRNRVSLAAYLKDKDEDVRQAAADLLNKGSDMVVSQIKRNLRNQGIKNRTGKLYNSIEIKRATAKSPNVVIMSEVFAPPPKKERELRIAWGKMTKHQKVYRRKIGKPPMKFKYPIQGVPYGRIIEFSPRINKPWFYKAWYDMRNRVKDMIVSGIFNTWSKK